MNCVCISGRSVSNAKEYALKNGGAVTTFTLAVKDRFKDASGEVEHVVYIDCAAYGKISAYAKSISKGNSVEVQGQLTTYKYTNKNGEIKWKTQVHVAQMTTYTPTESERMAEASIDADDFADEEGGEY